MARANAATVSNPSHKIRKPHRLHRVKTLKTEESLRFADITLRAIEANFSRSAFTRDDILTLVSRMRLDSTDTWAAGAYGVNDVATITRYHKVCDAVHELLVQQRLISLDWQRLCLPDMFEKLSQEIPPQILYLPTVRRLIVQHFSPGAVLDAMAVVRVWTSDQHLPENVKRMAVRGIFPLLSRERLLRRGDAQQFLVREV